MSAARSVRRADKQLAEAACVELLQRAHCGRLATVGADGWPYAVPLLFVWRDGEIWLHNSAARGHLRDNIAHEARVCFEVDEAGEVFPYGRYACDTSIAYCSVVAFGRVRIIDDAHQAAAFFDALMAKYAGARWPRPPSVYPRLDQVTVYALSIERLSGKQTALPPLAEQWPALDATKSPRWRDPAAP
jgi:nitroimidazol reductase NimA-like FMN-containing flavoprotein (pyridoxamine 5'-phosphate oxidase superfamily)